MLHMLPSKKQLVQPHNQEVDPHNDDSTPEFDRLRVFPVAELRSRVPCPHNPIFNLIPVRTNIFVLYEYLHKVLHRY